MDKLWQTRLRRHQKEQAKYLQRVFNDHFVLVLLVLFGALLYAYSNFVRGIYGHPFWVNLVVAGVAAASLLLGRLVTLMQKADVAFLLPKAGAMRGYLNQGRRYSMMLPVVIELATTVALWPLMTVGGNPNVAILIAVIVQQLTFAYASMSVQLTGLFNHKWDRMRLVIVALDFGFLLVGQLTALLPLALLGTVTAAGLTYATIAARKHEQLNVLRMVKREASRMATIYRFYNLFTDVPGLGGGVRRRKYLDWLLRRVPVVHAQTWAYLLVRGLVRSQEYFGLCIRLMIVGALAMWVAPTWWLGLIIDLAFSYLLGYQLLPLAVRYREIVFTHIYPVAAAGRKQAWSRIVSVVLYVQAVILGLVQVVHAPALTSALVLVLGLVFVPVLVNGYLRRRIAD
ncbi:ABC transporter permease [Lacticaseibacillus sharpeae]|uniref:ABC transporter permease n=1 Tax=Lacticaseibacillus sharpeae JCM 1186 = DSM 20505 TaxID=1291052 RepID=A0A0R1ZNM3_9LACO|nr:ABC transporter permease [Lacticaseibacillus sharpeae]KRM56589.1 ABC transporter permease [Lacticaseibacillus sharpeae JCM 1186 = DSM 20505]